MRKVLVFFLFLMSVSLYAQNDTLKLKNKDVLIGEVKTIRTGVLTMETDYSDQDFKIDFDEVSEMTIERTCLISLDKVGNRIGHVRSAGPGYVVITYETGEAETLSLSDIISLQEVEEKIWNRFKGSIDLGFNITKANRQRQLNLSSRLSYIGLHWLIYNNVNLLYANQTDVPETRRVDANLEATRLLNQNWFIVGEVSFLRNTEQALDGRISPNVGYGNLVINTPKTYLGLAVGLNFNIENFVNDAENRTSAEVFLSAALNLFNFDDLSLTSNIKLLPSLTEKGRFRTDYNFKIKLDLPLDFYISAGLTFNYDNQPVIEGNQFDYIINTGFGWSFN